MTWLVQGRALGQWLSINAFMTRHEARVWKKKFLTKTVSRIVRRK